MKMYAKEELEYKNGYLVNKENEVVAVDNEVVDLFNKLETDLQRSYWEKSQPKIELPVAGKFNRQSERGNVFAHIEAETPKLDKKIDEAIALMAELDDIEVSEKSNEYLKGLVPIQLFITDNMIIACEQGVPHRFDLPVVGNPLELTSKKLADLVLGMFTSREYEMTVNDE